MDRWRPIEIFALYLLAAASCTDTQRGQAAAGAGGTGAGRGGSSGRMTGDMGRPLAGRGETIGGTGGAGPIAGAAGGGGTPQRGDDCDAGKPAPAPPDPTQRACSGGYMTQNGCAQRYETVQCYVAEIKAGRPDCVPPDDPTLVPRLADYIFSSGFSAEFVIESAPDVDLPASCDAPTACCEQQTLEIHQLACFDVLDDTGHGSPDKTCSVFGTLDTRLGNGATWGDSCPALKPDSADDAGAAEPAQHGLCCYRTCGHGAGV